MKVLHLTPSFYPAFVYGGPTHSVHQLCLALAGAGCDVRVLTTDANGPDAVLDVKKDTELELGEGLRVRYCRRVMDVSVSPMLLRLLSSYVRWADVIHLTAVYSFPTIPTLLATRLHRKPVVWSPRGMLQRWSGSRRPKLKTLWERACRLASPGRLVLHVTSEEEAAQSVERLPGVRTALIPNGVDIPGTVRHVIESSMLRLVYLGRIDPKKGIENLLDACRLVDDSSAINYSLKIAGAGMASYVAALEAKVERLGLSNRVRFVGRVGQEQKEMLFAHADIVVAPSHTENFGLVVAEALAHGVPVIASRGTPWRRVEEVGCGLWVNNDPVSLAQAVSSMSLLPLRQMGLHGRNWVKREFAWPSLAAQMVAVYQSMLPQGGIIGIPHPDHSHVIQ